MAMKMADIQKEVKSGVFEDIKELFGERAEQYNDFELAVPVEIEGEGEFWAKVFVVCGQIKDTASSKAFDPFVARKEWEEDKATKARLAEEKAKAKAKKLAKSGKAKAE